jgi:hypothetical protein
VKAKGFNGINSTASLAVNGFDISPPDMGMGTGTSAGNGGPAGGQPRGGGVLAVGPGTGTVSLNAFFGLSPAWFTSDPRVYWDPQTKHWFLTMLSVGPPFGGAGTSSMQFIAVSRTKNALGAYTIFSFDTSTSVIDNSICPCLGDFDMVGADNSGFYITTNEFPITGPGFNGTNLYAMSKKGLIAAANGGPAVPVFLYPIPTLSDPFGAYHLAPSSVTQGSAVPNTEYFVESDANNVGNSALEVWALTGTKSLNASTPTAPPLSEASVATQGYSQPPNAVQKSGPIPFGNTVGAKVASPLSTNDDEVQQVTYASGELYAHQHRGQRAAAPPTRAWLFALPEARRLGVGHEQRQLRPCQRPPAVPVDRGQRAGQRHIAFALSAGATS